MQTFIFNTTAGTVTITEVNEAKATEKFYRLFPFYTLID